MRNNIKQFIGFVILASVLFGCQDTKQKQQKVILRTFTIYRDTCNLDSEFISKISQIESGGTDSISGEQGRGKGRFGIYQICVKGSGLADLLDYTHDDMYSREKSEHVFWAMMGIFCHQYAQKHGKYPTYEDLARMWAGGPEGYHKESTLRYLDKFRKL